MKNKRISGYNIARHHHERYDGAGYPNGLKGEEIPPGGPAQQEGE